MKTRLIMVIALIINSYVNGQERLASKVYFKSGEEFGPGDYYVNARNAIHTVWADSSTIIQLTGIGPWEANFIEE